MKRFALLALLISTSARADTVGVDVSDLPPLPAADEAPSMSATVLAASAAEEDVVVGAAKREQSLGNVASAVTVVSADRIRRFGYRTVAEAIAAVAGVFIQDTRLTQQVGIRGLQVPGAFNGRILVLVDGAAVNEAWGAFAGVGFDGIVSIDDISRIEVIRGPVSSQYGTNAFLMTVNIVTRGAAEGQRAWGRIGIHSINGEIATAGFAQGSLDKQLRGSVMVMNRLGESITVPEIDAAPLTADGANTLVAAVVGTYGGSFGQVRAVRSRRDSLFAPYDASPTSDPGYALYNYQLIAEGGHTRELTERFTGSVRGYVSLYRYFDQINDGSNDLFVDYGDAATFGGEVRGRYEVLDEGRLGISGGVEVNYNKTESRAFLESDEANGVTVPVDFSNQGVYTEVDTKLTDWLGASAGARFDRNSVIENGTRLSPRAALFLTKDQKAGLKLLYAEGFRNPSMFEGFFDDGRDFAANTDISPEVIRSFEAVAWLKLGGLSARISGFNWDARDVIEQRPFTNEAMLEVLQFQNIGRYVTRGVEAEASYRDSRGWYGFGGVSFNSVGTEVIDDMGNTELVFGKVFDAPKITAAGGVSTPKLFGYAHLGLEGQYISRRRTRLADDPMAAAAAKTSIPWVGLNATLYLPNLRGFDVTFGGRNLIGKRDQVPAPDDYDRFPDPATTIVVAKIPGEGREVYVKVGYSY